MANLIIVRHGTTDWNEAGIFTGWADVPLNDRGRREARETGVMLRNMHIEWHAAYTSCLSRAVETAGLVLKELDSMSLEIIADWRLNERHVGALQGKSHVEVAHDFGWTSVEAWRWGWNDCPPRLSAEDERQKALSCQTPHLGNLMPTGESFAEVIERLKPWFLDAGPRFMDEQNILVFTHSTTLRALRAMLEGLSSEDIREVRPRNGGIVLYSYQEAGIARRIAQLCTSPLITS